MKLSKVLMASVGVGMSATAVLVCGGWCIYKYLYSHIGIIASIALFLLFLFAIGGFIAWALIKAQDRELI